MSSKVDDDNDDYYTSETFNFLKNKNINNTTKPNEINNNKNISRNKVKIPKDAQFLNEKSSAYEKDIKQSNKAIYAEPVPNYDGFFTKTDILNKALYSEEVNKKVRIQNLVQSQKNEGESRKNEKIDMGLINKYNQDISVNINKYIEEDLLIKKRKAIFKTLKAYLLSLEKQKEKIKKKKVYRIKKRKPSDIESEDIMKKIEEDEKNVIKKQEIKNEFIRDLDQNTISAYRKSLLISLYGFYIGNIIYDTVFSKIKI